MKSYLIPTLLLFIQTLLFAQPQRSGVSYHIDLTRVQNDRLFVTMDVPKPNTAEVTFRLPGMIPGTYAIADYGRFVSGLQALDKKGHPLTVVKTDENSWKITDATKLVKITYWVDDNFDELPSGPSIYPMASTNIEQGKNVVLNNSGFFGYLDSCKNLPSTLYVTRAGDEYGSTGLIPVSSNLPVRIDKENKPLHQTDKIDTYAVDNYDRLVDSPIMYCKADTTIIRVGNTEVLISSYSPNGKVTSKEIAENVRDILMAQKEYLNGKLPVEKYAFLFYFTDKPIISYGALEHSYSSFYYMPERTIGDMRQQLRDFASHEFFHIITPLTIHSKEIEPFDFHNPKMSRHLWLYEGVTEYFAGHVQVWNHLITPEQYLNVIHNKLVQSTQNYNDTLAFTELSSKVLGETQSQYNNVYEKGALIGLCLDILLRKSSEGKYGLKDLLADLSKKYGKSRAFNDDELFDQITKLTYPEIGTFLNRYVAGSEKLPFSAIFEMVGLTYIPQEIFWDFSLGWDNKTIAIVNVPERENKPRVAIANSNALNPQGKALGFQDGDVLLEINHEKLPDLGPAFRVVLDEQKKQFKSGGTLSYLVLRKDASGQQKEIELTAPLKDVEQYRRHLVKLNELADESQMTLRKAWLNQ